MQSYYFPIDALRFASALSVVLFHLTFYSWASGISTSGHAFGGAARLDFLAPWTWFCWVGVEVFFVISGFVIAASANGATPIAFVRGRVSRLYPAVPVCALISLIALVAIVGDPLGGLVAPFLNSVLLLPDGPWIDGVYWSLAVEIVFYSLIFFILVIGKFGSIRFLAWGLTLWSGAFLAAHVYFSQHPEIETGWWPLVKFKSEILLVQNGCFFGVGIWLWLASRRLVGFSGAAGLLTAIAVSCAAIYVHVKEDMGGVVDWTARSPLLPIGVWLASVAVIYWTSRDVDRWTPRSDGARQRLRRLGAMTYPLYLVHNVAGAAFSRLLIGAGLNPLAAILCAITAMIGLSYIISRFWEPLARRHLQRVLQMGETIIRGRAKQLAFLFTPGGAVALPEKAIGQAQGS